MADKGELKYMPGVDEEFEEPERVAITLDARKDGRNTESIVGYLGKERIFPVE